MSHLFRHSLGSMIFLFCLSLYANAQQDNTGSSKVTPKELSIPASPVFDLMGVTPSQVTRTSDIKDFKVDWSFKSWRLNPNLALQSQPVWELFYNRKNLQKYQHASSFMRHLASIDFSAGTVQNEDNDRRIGAALKINLFKRRDPLMAKELYAGLAEKYESEKQDLEKQLLALQIQLDTTTDILKRPGIKKLIDPLEDQILSIPKRRSEEISSRAKIFVEENWNASFIDLAFGKINTFATDSTGSLTSLRLNRNTASGIWINAGWGIGKKILVTTLVRSSFYEEQVDFLLHDLSTGIDQSEHSIAKNTLLTTGLNLRYGGPIYTFFAEIIYERRSLHTPQEALDHSFKAPPGSSVVVNSSLKWTALQPFTFSAGGDWRISRNVILNYGMRCIFNDSWKLDTFIPVASVSCMMR
jgi:hypothetical protein